MSFNETVQKDMLTFSVTGTNMWTSCICYYLFVFNTCSLHWPDELYYQVLSLLWLVAWHCQWEGHYVDIMFPALGHGLGLVCIYQVYLIW